MDTWLLWWLKEQDRNFFQRAYFPWGKMLQETICSKTLDSGCLIESRYLSCSKLISLDLTPYDHFKFWLCDCIFVLDCTHIIHFNTCASICSSGFKLSAFFMVIFQNFVILEISWSGQCCIKPISQLSLWCFFSLLIKLLLWMFTDVAVPFLLHRRSNKK